MTRQPTARQRYDRRAAERRFGHLYASMEGDCCLYCGMSSDGKVDHQPPVYVLHRFANGSQVTKKQVREAFGDCRLVPCCTICNMGLGTFYAPDDRDRRAEIVGWFLEDEQNPLDKMILIAGRQLLEDRLNGRRGPEVYTFPGVGRLIYIAALVGLADGTYRSPDDFPKWLKAGQAELAEWLRGAPRRKYQHFLDMAGLESYQLRPHARSDPRGQFGSTPS